MGWPIAEPVTPIWPRPRRRDALRVSPSPRSLKESKPEAPTPEPTDNGEKK